MSELNDTYWLTVDWDDPLIERTLTDAEQIISALREVKEKWKDDCIILQDTFRHTHSSAGKEKGDDSCAECGLDLRHPVHTLKEDKPNG